MRWGGELRALQLLGLLAILAQQFTYVYTSAYVMLEGDCPGPSILFVRNSVQVTLTSNPLRYMQRARRKCSLVFQAQRITNRLLLHWDALRVMPYNQGHRVFLRSGRYIPTPGEGRVDFHGQDYRSHHNHITLFYTGFPHFDYLKVTVTEIRVAQTCLDQEVLCPRGDDSFCISHELLCNGENNCGDGNVSDENHTSCMKSHAPTVPPADSPMLYGLLGVLGVQPLIIAVLIATCCIIKRRQKAKRAVEVPPHLQHRANNASFLCNRNEYVTLPHTASLTPHKEPPEEQLPAVSTGVRSTPLFPTQLPDHWPPGETATQRPGGIRLSGGNASQPPRGTALRPPTRSLPPTPEEEPPESNYVNLQPDGGSLHLPLLFPVPDTNSVPLFHTIGLQKAVIAPNLSRLLPRETQFSISEPGYMNIEDFDLVPLAPSERQKSDKVKPRQPSCDPGGDHRVPDTRVLSASHRGPVDSGLSRSLKPSSRVGGGDGGGEGDDEPSLLDPRSFPGSKSKLRKVYDVPNPTRKTPSRGVVEHGWPDPVSKPEKVPRRCADR